MVALCLVVLAFAEPPKITISKETTYITAPLRADGMVDYEAALNALNGRAKPEENAAADLADLVGPSIATPKLAEEFFRRLGRPLPPKSGAYLKSLREMLGVEDLSKEAEAELERCRQTPWKLAEYPRLAELLSINEPFMERLVAASKKPKFIYPLLSGRDPPLLLSTHLGPTQAARTAIQLLLLRAMSRLQRNDLDGAISDLDAARRFAVLVGSGKRFLIEGLVSNRTYQYTVLAERRIAFSPTTPLETLRRRAKLWEDSPPPFDIHAAVDVIDRMTMLSTTAYAIQYGLDKAVFDGVEFRKSDRVEPLYAALKKSVFDADEALRTVNRYYDRAAKAAENPERLNGNRELSDMGRELAKQKRDRESQEEEFFLFRKRRTHPNGPASANGEEFGRLCLEYFAPAVSMAFVDGVKVRVDQRFTILAYAFSAHKRQHGSYPDSLDAKILGLQPKTLIDPFTEKDFVYRSENGKRQVVCAWSDHTIGPYPRPGRLKPYPVDDVILELP